MCAGFFLLAVPMEEECIKSELTCTAYEFSVYHVHIPLVNFVITTGPDPLVIVLQTQYIQKLETRMKSVQKWKEFSKMDVQYGARLENR